MSKVDDELTRRLRRAERPVGGDELFEGLARRRSRRERLRRVQAGLVAFAVLAATAAGFAALREAFDGNGRDVAEAPILASNGEIVFSRKGDDGRFHLYAAHPDGSDMRQITRDATNDTDPAVSPGGEAIAFVHELDRSPHIQVIATVPIDGGIVTWHTPEDLEASDPAWSSDGSTIAFVGRAEQSVPPGFEAPERYRAIFTVSATSGTPRRITDGGIPSVSDPSWSHDDRSIAFAGGSCASSCDNSIQSDLYIVDVVTTDGRKLISSSPDIDEEAPAWSPDGTRIAFTRPGEEGDEVWTMDPYGGSETVLAIAVDASLEPDLAWAPDGTSLLVSDGEWIYRVDAAPKGDPRDNFVQLVEGDSPAWQPLPVAAEPSVTTNPEPSQEPEGLDIGLGFNMCNLQRLSGIDFLGEGSQGRAWTGARVKENGACPDPSLGATYLVAVDIDGDGAADASSETVEHCFFCRPFDVVDLDLDGAEELVLLASEGSTPTFMIYGIDGVGGDRAIVPLLVAEPGHPEARIDPGAPLMFSTGGDEGFAGWVGCDGAGGELILEIRWRDHPIEGDTQEVHKTGLALREHLFHVVRREDYSLPAGSPVPGASNEPACGVDWQI
jgi:dipeptidyl aminopeptidase/acylaminoacyl peptidase